MSSAMSVLIGVAGGLAFANPPNECHADTCGADYPWYAPATARPTHTLPHR